MATKPAETLTNAIQKEIAEKFINKPFSVLDFNDLVMARGERTGHQHHIMAALERAGLIECCGEMHNPRGGKPINRYRVTDKKRIAIPISKKTSAEIQRETKERHQRMHESSLNLQRALGIGCHA